MVRVGCRIRGTVALAGGLAAVATLGLVGCGGGAGTVSLPSLAGTASGASSGSVPGSTTAVSSGPASQPPSTGVAPVGSVAPSATTPAEVDAAVVAGWKAYLVGYGTILRTTGKTAALHEIAAVTTGPLALATTETWAQAQRSHAGLLGGPVSLGPVRILTVSSGSAAIHDCVDENDEYTYDTRTHALIPADARRKAAGTRVAPRAETADLTRAADGRWRPSKLDVGAVGSCAAP